MQMAEKMVFSTSKNSNAKTIASSIGAKMSISLFALMFVIKIYLKI